MIVILKIAGMSENAMFALYVLNTEDAKPGNKAKPFWKTVLRNLYETALQKTPNVSLMAEGVGMRIKVQGQLKCQNYVPVILDSDIIRIIHKIFKILKDNTGLQDAMKLKSFHWRINEQLSNIPLNHEQLSDIPLDPVIDNIKKNFYHILDNYYGTKGYYNKVKTRKFDKFVKYLPDSNKFWDEEAKNNLIMLINNNRRTEPDKEISLIKSLIDFLLNPYGFKLKPAFSCVYDRLSDKMDFNLYLEDESYIPIVFSFKIDFNISYEDLLRLVHNKKEFAKWFKKSIITYTVYLQKKLNLNMMTFDINVLLERSRVIREQKCYYEFRIRSRVYPNQSLIRRDRVEIQFEDLLFQLKML